MSDTPPRPTSTMGEHTPGDRLDSWKEIAAYVKRDVTTVQRWERRERMPVHRHLHDKMGSVYAYRSELDAWARSRRPADAPPTSARPVTGSTQEPPATQDASGPAESLLDREPATPAPGGMHRGHRTRWAILATGGFLLAVLAVLAMWRPAGREPAAPNPLAGARYRQLTDFGGIERAAALSRDGRFVAFQSDRDGRMDVWVTQVGTGKYANLTRGSAGEIVNPFIRELGFSPDGALVTYWSRRPGEGAQRGISIWAVPLLGGEARPYLEGAAEYDWSGDAARLVFHTPGPGDPMYHRDGGTGSEGRKIFSAPEGLHAHFLLWSPDGAFVYFIQGILPDRLDIWRIRPAGGAPERITHHDTAVTHPVFLDARTLLYLATEPDGSGPWIHAVDVEERVPRRVSSGGESYTSLAASADGQRLVVTRASPRQTLWRVPMDARGVDMSTARRVMLATGNASFARLGPDFLVYVASKGTSDSLWKVQGQATTELWSAPDARIVAAPAIRSDGRRIAFTARQAGRTMLYVVNADGTEARSLATALDLQGSPAWAPAGDLVTIAGNVNGAPRLFNVPANGGPPAPLATGHSVDPMWSPRGDLVVFTGADVGTTFPLQAARPDGTPRPIPTLMLPRGARHLAFTPEGRSLVVLKGEIRHKNLWVIDLDTGAERQVTDVGPDVELSDFDLSPDGRELVLTQVQERSDVVFIERSPAARPR